MTTEVYRNMLYQGDTGELDDVSTHRDGTAAGVLHTRHSPHAKGMMTMRVYILLCGVVCVVSCSLWCSTSSTT